ncbi:MAG: ABC transporter permease [Clostridiales bacterium]|nr:ABC transporter permease [Clostridiales bacterium]
MKLITTILLALKNIRGNKLRSTLTMLGLIIGISSVIVLVGIGTGTSSKVTSQVSSLGTNLLTVSIDSSKSLKLSDVDGLSNRTGIESVAPYTRVNTTVSKGSTTEGMSSVLGINQNYFVVRNYTLSYGRKISFIDVDSKSKVCIIGATVSEDLFGNSDPIGQTIKIGGDNYTVIGVLESQGSSMGMNADNTVLIPITTAKYISGSSDVNSLYIKAANENSVTLAQLSAENYLRNTLDATSDEVSVSTQQSMLEAMSSIQSALTLLLLGIASISLIVGGIGVMNVMLVSVTERTKEIGIRKSLGANRTDILIQFLIEALVLCLMGGIIGILAGIGIGSAVKMLGYTFACSISVVALAFGFAVLIGLVFGIFPAYRASRLNPIDALRQE